jgi:hypothetical protein
MTTIDLAPTLRSPDPSQATLQVSATWRRRDGLPDWVGTETRVVKLALENGQWKIEAIHRVGS